MFDTVLLSGTVHDGSGGSPTVCDLAIRDGRIAAIGALASASAAEIIDVAGLAVSPGFIDLHTHSDFTLDVDGRAQSQVHQGVTTGVSGQWGISCAPLRDAGSRSDIILGDSDGPAV